MAEEPLQRVRDEAARLREAEQEADAIRDELYAAVRDAHRSGASLAAIARAWGVSRQRVAAIVQRA